MNRLNTLNSSHIPALKIIIIIIIINHYSLAGDARSTYTQRLGWW